MNVLDADGGARWVRYIRRAQQFFGLVYYQTSHSVAKLQPFDKNCEEGRSLDLLPSWLIPRVMGTGAFDGTSGINQVAANDYLGRSGVGVHVEDPAAGGTIASVSLLRPVEFTLQRAVRGSPVAREFRDSEDCVKILLEPRSILLMQGEARYDWAHCIRTSRIVHLRDGTIVRRDADYRRVSLTFREILKDRRQPERQDLPQGFAGTTNDSRWQERAYPLSAERKHAR